MPNWKRLLRWPADVFFFFPEPAFHMAGLYFHIPFCRKACVYCDFHFVTSLKQRGEMVHAMTHELRTEAANWGFGPFSTVYFGGGTPSVLESDQLEALLREARENAGISEGAEITLEANPDDLTPERLQAWRTMGINRLSVGVQAFEADTLAWMNRSHSVQEVYQGLEAARKAGFDSFNLDLIFGWPGLTDEIWLSQIRTALSLQPDHLSVYSLTVEEKTALAHQVKKKAVALPDQNAYARQFILAHETLVAEGFGHYEISNYALPGKESRHNSSYWSGAPYLGIGPSAHSFDGKNRWWNVAHNARYLQAAETGFAQQRTSEALQPLDHYHEYLMTAFRRQEGVNVEWIGSRYVPGWRQRFGGLIRQWEAANILYWRNENELALTPEGWMVADDLISRFFLDHL